MRSLNKKWDAPFEQVKPELAQNELRSVEDFKKFLSHKYSRHIIQRQLNESICQEPEFAHCGDLFRYHEPIFLFGNKLMKLFKLSRPDFAENGDIQICFDDTKNSRNKLFHGLEGLEHKEVFENWGCENQAAWENRVLSCLNFITEQKFDRLQQASLMSTVHQVIAEGIANYRPEG